MPKRFDLTVLFEKTRYVERPGSGYRSYKAELDAVRSGKKALSLLSVDREWIESKHFAEVHAEAHKRDLLVVLDPDRRGGIPTKHQHVRLFILPALGLTFFYGSGCGMKGNAAELAPKGTTIARFSLVGTFSWKVLGKPSDAKNRGRKVRWGNVSKELAPLVNSRLCSPIEFLGRRGWS